MHTADLQPLLPLLVLSGAIAVTLLASAFIGKGAVTAALTAAGLTGSFIALFFAPHRSVTALLLMDGYASFYMGLIFASALAVALLSAGYLRARPAARTDEYYLLLLLATLGSAILVASDHFASFFLGLEILSVSLYVLISYQRESQRGIEAATKYLVLAGTSSAFLLFGMALVYSSLGTMELARIGPEIAALGGGDLLSAVGMGMVIVGIGYKLALAPFHMWSPDIYEGAPAPVTAYVATVSKGAMFALLFRYFSRSGLHPYPGLFTALAVLAILSMLVGNLLALRQNNLKRLLAYSSISHLGYLLVALLAGAPLGAGAVAFYLVSYFVTTLAAFGVIGAVSGRERDSDQIRDFQAMFWRRPFLASVFAASMLSLAGIPLTAGFVGKFYLVIAGVGATLWALVVILVLNSAIALYYYLRVIFAIFAPEPAAPAPGEIVSAGVPLFSSGAVVLIALSAILLWLGIYPSPILHLIQGAMASLSP